MNAGAERRDAKGSGMTGTRRTTERIERALGVQRELYARLDELSAAQAELIAGDHTDALLTLLSERGGVVAQLEAASGELRAAQVELDAVGGLAEPDRGRVRAMVDQVRAAAERIAERDATDERALAERRDAISARLTGNARGRSAVAAYGGAGRPSGGPRFQDRSA